jgi:hypothetical protein
MDGRGYGGFSGGGLCRRQHAVDLCLSLRWEEWIDVFLDGLVASSTSSIGMGGSSLSNDGPWGAVVVFGFLADTDACLKRLGYALLCTIVIERLLVV